MHMSTSPCDFGHRLHRLLPSSLEWNDSEVHRVSGAGFALLAERARWVRVARGAFRSRIPARHC
jgi:ABC-type transporter Mla MlaB component